MELVEPLLEPQPETASAAEAPSAPSTSRPREREVWGERFVKFIVVEQPNRMRELCGRLSPSSPTPYVPSPPSSPAAYVVANPLRPSPPSSPAAYVVANPLRPFTPYDPRWTVLGGEVAVPCTRNPL